MGTVYSRQLDTLVDKYDKVYRSIRDVSGTVIEFGCSDGYFLVALSSRGITAIGVEGNPEAAELARSRGLSVLTHDLEAGLPEGIDFGSVSAVLLMDVLEHLRKPEVFLKDLYDSLPVGAQVLVTGPNVAHFSMRVNLLRGRWDYSESGILDRTHYKFFTLSTWQNLLTEAGFAIDEVCCAEVPPLPANRFFSAILGKKFSRRLAAFLANQFPSLFCIVLFVSADVRKSGDARIKS